jgi:hypothetical protein
VDDDEKWIENYPKLDYCGMKSKKKDRIGKTSGFERLYGKVTRLYFGGMAHHLATLRSVITTRC